MLNNPPEVMLAHKMDKPITYYTGWRIQEKVDGIRALIIKEGNEIVVFGRNQTLDGRAHFTDSLPEVVEFFKNHQEDFMLDCELMSKDFLTLQTKVRTKKSVVHDPHFYIKAFDILKWGQKDLISQPHDVRYDLLLNFVASSYDNRDRDQNRFLRAITQAPKPLTPEYLEVCLSKVLDKGGEGLVIKDPNGLYLPGKRYRGWVKVLPEPDMDVIFTGAIRGEGKYGHTLGALQAFGLNPDGSINPDIDFNVGTGWTEKVRDQIWDQSNVEGFFPIPGKVKYKNLYPSGCPRMPVFHSFNADKEV